MLRITGLTLPLDHGEAELRAAIARQLGLPEAPPYTVFRRGYDARRKNAGLCFVYTVDVEVPDEARLLARRHEDRKLGLAPDTRYRMVAAAKARSDSRPLVAGFGPCGIFAALLLAQMGFRPIVLERGKAVRERTQDTWGLWLRRVLDPESNVQFGEGGAGLFSDGKLHSGIRDPYHRGRKVLEEFVKAGAPEEILYLSKPHIGTFRLTGIVERIRAEIETLGGEIRFGARVTDLHIEDGRVRGVGLANGTELRADQVVLALGHSARDTFRMLQDRGVHLDPKPFSLGFRIEHPQSLIDRARLGRFAGNPKLGAADYKLVHHAANGRSVYSFCMCPGGTVVAATSESERVVTNGMSQYSRNERNANAGIVVGISPEDYPGGPLAGLPCRSSGNRGPTCWAAAATKRRSSWWATSSPSGPRRPWARCCPPTSLACAPPISPRPCPPTPSKRSAKPCPPSAASSAASPCTTPCLPAWRPAPPRPCASPAAKACKASTSKVCTRAEKVRAMPAASCPRRSTGSVSPRRWHSIRFRDRGGRR